MLTNVQMLNKEPEDMITWVQRALSFQWTTDSLKDSTRDSSHLFFPFILYFVLIFLESEF